MTMTANSSRLGEESSRALYQKLHPRPNGLPRAQVASHQRERLCRAVLEAAASENGCERTSISELCSLAGVSKRAFYEIFRGKQECLAAAHERAVCRVAERMRRAPSVMGWPQDSLQAGLSVLLAEAARRPEAARFALIDAVDATPAALERQRWAARQIEREIARRLQGAREAPVSPLALRGIVAGLSHVVCTRLLDGRAAELPLLAPELTAWALGCAALIPTGSSAAGAQARAFPSGTRGADERGAGPPTKLFAQRDERALLMESALALVAQGGMLRLSPEALAIHSGVPARRLHAVFGDHEQCLLEALRHGGRHLLDGAIAAGMQQRQWRHGLRAGLLTLLAGLDAQQPLAHALSVGALSLGARAHSVRAELVDRATHALRRALPPAAPLPSAVCQASVGAAWGLVAEQPADFGATRLQGLVAPVEAILVAPALGAIACA